MQHPETTMTTAGWVFLITGWTAIITLAVFCISRILGARRTDEPNGDAE